MEVDHLAKQLMGAPRTIVRTHQRLLIPHKVHHVNRRAFARRREADHDGGAGLAQAIDRLADRRRAPVGIEGEVDAAAGHSADGGDRVFAVSVHEVRRAEPAGVVKFVVVEVDRDHAGGVHDARTLDGVEADAPATEDGDGRARLHARRIDHGSHARGDATADERRDLHAHIGRHGIAGLRGHDRLLREHADLRHLTDLVAFAITHAEGAIKLASAGVAEGVAEVREASAAAFAIAAIGDEREDAAVAGIEPADSFAERLDRARAFVAERRRQRKRAGAVDDVVVAGAYASRAHFDEHFAPAWRFQVQFDDLEWLAGFVKDGGFHGGSVMDGESGQRGRFRC